MIERFEVGKSYRWIGQKERPWYWNHEGKMDFLLGETIHKCVVVRKGMEAGFENNLNPYNNSGVWGFHGDESNFEEVTE